MLSKPYACAALVVFLGLIVSNGVCSTDGGLAGELEEMLLKMLINKKKAAEMNNQRQEVASKSNLWKKLSGMLQKTSAQSDSDPWELLEEYLSGHDKQATSSTFAPPITKPLKPSPEPPTANLVSIPVCGYGQPVCECNAKARECEIFLEIDEIMTFTSYQKVRIGLREGLAMRGRKGALHLIDKNSGKIVPHPRSADSPCAMDSDFNETLCSQPQFIDGKNYRMIIGVNGQLPGPTIIAYENQMVRINVHNNLSTEGISIHWHGMHQRGSPWMDGVGLVSQCPIGPSSSFSYIYKAYPAGTFWYHSHSGAQRTDGFFGTLVVKESNKKVDEVNDKLPSHLKNFKDLPDKHSLSLIDWQHEASLSTVSQLDAGLGIFPGVPLGELPTACDEGYSGYRNVDNSGISPLPFYSGLINGMGRHRDVPYSQTRLSVFPVVKGELYRFRLIGAQGIFAYKFSVDGHKLTVVNTDGYWIKPVEDVDYVIIHAGERYDFLLKANQKAQSYWMRAETLEIINKGNVPYPSVGNVAEGILQYVDSMDSISTISSTDYEEIKLKSPKRDCVRDHCIVVNCPFKKYHVSYNTECINVDELKLLLPTKPEEMPKPLPDDCDGCLQFFNFNFEGNSDASSINGRNFILPPAPPETQYDDFVEQAVQCNRSLECNPSTLGCSCTHVTEIPFNKTIQFVLSSVGRVEVPHPVHLHGHTFHVVKVGYPDYDMDEMGTGSIADEHKEGCDEDFKVNAHNKDIECLDKCDGANETCPENKVFPDGCHPYRCTKTHWKDGMNQQENDFCVTSETIRKDTVMIPAGGYVVINFISDNPGFWFMHCHIEPHQIEGMAIIIDEKWPRKSMTKRPANLNKCGDFNMKTKLFQDSVEEVLKSLGQEA